MSKPRKNKRPTYAASIPQDADQANAMVRQIGAWQRDVTRLETDMNETIAGIREEFESRAQPIKAMADAYIDAVQVWAEANRAALTRNGKVKSAQLPAALSFMSGEGKLADEFDAKLLPSKNPDRLRVELTPKRHAGDYKLLIMEVDRATFAVEASTVVDPVGNTNHLVFNGVKTNQSLPDKGFQFSPPAGVKIITGGQ